MFRRTRRPEQGFLAEIRFAVLARHLVERGQRGLILPKLVTTPADMPQRLAAQGVLRVRGEKGVKFLQRGLKLPLQFQFFSLEIRDGRGGRTGRKVFQQAGIDRLKPGHVAVAEMQSGEPLQDVRRGFARRIVAQQPRVRRFGAGVIAQRVERGGALHVGLKPQRGRQRARLKQIEQQQGVSGSARIDERFRRFQDARCRVKRPRRRMVWGDAFFLRLEPAIPNRPDLPEPLGVIQRKRGLEIPGALMAFAQAQGRFGHARMAAQRFFRTQRRITLPGGGVILLREIGVGVEKRGIRQQAARRKTLRIRPQNRFGGFVAA